MLAIELHGVVKRFGEITAVNGLDLEVPEGICSACSGPTGPCVSTTMRLLTGQALPDAGEIGERRASARGQGGAGRDGCRPRQLDNLDVDVSVEDNLAVFARLYRVKDVHGAVDRGLAPAPGGAPRDAVDRLSGGMRRRLLLARGLIHDPRLALLDEPTVGLDPQIRTELWSLIDGLRAQG